MKRETRHELKQIAYLREYEDWFAHMPRDRWPADTAPVDDWLRVWSNEPQRTQMNTEVTDWFEHATVHRDGQWLIAESNGVTRLYEVQEGANE